MFLETSSYPHVAADIIRQVTETPQALSCIPHMTACTHTHTHAPKDGHRTYAARRAEITLAGYV